MYFRATVFKYFRSGLKQMFVVCCIVCQLFVITALLSTQLEVVKCSMLKYLKIDDFNVLAFNAKFHFKHGGGAKHYV